jgi:hypothetical protein
MSYLSIDLLTFDNGFNRRVRSCCVEQAQTFASDTRLDIAALGNEELRGGGPTTLAFVRIMAAFPGIAERITLPDGTVDQSLIDDADILAQVQANWPTVAALYWDPDGNRLPFG